MASTLSPYRLGKARDLYNLFNVFNAFSWALLSGNFITLFAMRMNASSTYLGLLNAMVYASFFFLPLGKWIAQWIPLIRIYSAAWILRALAMTPLAAAPALAAAGRQGLALNLTFLGVMIFHLFRGVGMIGNNPVLNELASGPDRGSYLTRIQVINSAVGMFASFAIAVLLGRNPPLFLYGALIVLGIIGGICSGVLVQRIPEPAASSAEDQPRFWRALGEAVSRQSIRHFMLILFLLAFTSAIARIFVVVYSREVFQQGDGMVALYTVFGGLGVLMIGLLVKFLIDRIGAKPIYIICTITAFLSILPIIFFPAGAVDTTATVALFLAFLHFAINFGFLGAEGIAQTYFLALIPPAYVLDMGILYFLVFGVAGAGGSFIAGLALDLFASLEITPFIAYKILYALLAVLTALALILQKRLLPLNSLPFHDAVEILFSFRDLKAITLLDRLNKSSGAAEEEALLEALQDTPSQLSIQGLLERTRSPRLAVRSEAIRALGAMKTLDERVEAVLLQDLIANPYTTAYISARILGLRGYSPAIPILRELADSEDYMLAGEAVIALARLNDEVFRPHIEALVLGTGNPRLKIMGVQAFGLYQNPRSLSSLLEALRDKDPPPYLRDETVLAMASILRIQDQFYPLLIRFLAGPSLLEALAMDEVESAQECYYASLGGRKTAERAGRKRPAAALGNTLAASLRDAALSYVRETNGAPLSQWIRGLPEEGADILAQTILGEAVLDDELASYKRLRLLIVQWSAYCLRSLGKRGGRHKAPRSTI